MTQCPTCSAILDDTARFCSECGAEVSSISRAPTAHATPQRGATPASPVGRLAAEGTSDPSGIPPGFVLGDRYRMIGLIGRGGMGEVYRADDLRLGQPVALKFLPAALATDIALRERFFVEVRLARSVSHSNVCRVYDVAEHEGRLFLSMEYIDGEDLASLLRRIGRLPREKALQISRQLCGGLAAAHEREVLHRDLKPSNVMLDGRGQARITDFGLAVVAGRGATEAAAGTPAYMAPEQLDGRPATVRTDVYGLGLVLYELWTGRRAFDARSIAELRIAKRSLPQRPSEVAPDVDPAVERVILRCLDPDPARRPGSVVQIVAALPGGDPLAAALAAGDTPSPELVAASSARGALGAKRAAAMLAAVLGMLAAFAVVPWGDRLVERVRLARGPEYLGGIAEDFLTRVGVAPAHGMRARGFQADWDLLDYVEAHDRSPGRWDPLAALRPVRFWYRASPSPLVSSDEDGRVWFDDPPVNRPGMSAVRLDPAGRLTWFHFVPDSLPAERRATDWRPFFVAAELDTASLRPATPEPFAAYADERLAWESTNGDSAKRLRVEAASLMGRPTAFEVRHPWTPSPIAEATLPYTSGAYIPYLVVVLIGWIGGLLLARRSWRLRQGDRRGSFIVAAMSFTAAMTVFALRANHVADLSDEWDIARRAMAAALFWAATLWVVYLALEPSVRRRWPEILVSWNRLLAGDFTDPLVGRDVLTGLAVGLGVTLFARLEYHAPRAFGLPAPGPYWSGVFAIGSIGDVLGYLAGGFRTALVEGLGVLILILIARLVFRKRWLADALLVVAVGRAVQIYPSPLWIFWPIAIVRAAIWIMLLARVGLLAFIAGLVAWYTLQGPVDVHPGNWFAACSWEILALLVALAVAAYATASGRFARPIPGADSWTPGTPGA